MKKIYINITMIYIERNSRYYEHPLNERGETLSKLISHDFGCICWWDVKKGAKEDFFIHMKTSNIFTSEKNTLMGSEPVKRILGNFQMIDEEEKGKLRFPCYDVIVVLSFSEP